MDMELRAVHETEMIERRANYSDLEIIQLDEISRVINELRS